MPKGYPANGVKRKARTDNRCAICKHAERSRIEALHCAGVSLERLAEKFDVHKDAVWRHMQRHVTEERKASYLIGPAKIAALAEVAAEESESILDYLNILRSSLFALLDKRAAEGDHYAVSMLSSRATEVLREIGKLTGQISNFANNTVINVQNNTTILNSPPFADLQGGLLRVCAAHPEARADIIALFHDLDRKYNGVPAQMITAPAMREVREAAHAQ
jgi:hypothetical protein